MSPVFSMLIRHEGNGPTRNGRFFVYDDATGKAIVPGSVLTGHPTIGNGRALDELGISQDEKDDLLSNDVVRVLTELKAAYAWFAALDSVRQDALVDACMNLGLTKFLGFREMAGALLVKNYTAAAAALLDSNAARALPARYQELATMLTSGAYVTIGDSTNA